MGPSQLRRLAAGHRRQAERLEAAAAERLRLAGILRKQAEELEGFADIGEKQPLHKSHALSIVGKSNMDNDHRLNISRSRSRAAPRDSFSSACRKAKLTQGGLARALQIDPALLSRYRKGTRPIPQERADKVKALTGWPADKAHWPGGIVPLD